MPAEVSGILNLSLELNRHINTAPLPGRKGSVGIARLGSHFTFRFETALLNRQSY